MKLDNFKPSKKLGQNFLFDRSALKKVILAANLKPEEIVLEIGPGTGLLTKEIVKRVKKVIAVEKDQRLIKLLEKDFQGVKKIELIHGDILKNLNLKLLAHQYKVVGNLPFYLTSAVIRKFLESENPPKEMILIVQKEVAQRICSQPPAMNLLALSVQFYAQPKIISFIPRKSFWPQPKVDTAIIKLKIKKERESIDKDLFFKIAKAGFSHSRKQLINNLPKKLGISKEEVINWISKSNIKPEQRAETLSLENWLSLTKTLFDFYNRHDKIKT